MADSEGPTNSAPVHSAPAESNRRKSANGTHALPPEHMVGGASAHLLRKRPAVLVFRAVFTFTGASRDNGHSRTVHSIAHVVCYALHMRGELATFG